MAGDLERDRIIGLLESLGSERDEDVVEAAREIHAQVTAAGIPWDVLLAPDTAADEAPIAAAADEAPIAAAADEAPDTAAEDEAPIAAAEDEAPVATAEEEDEDAAGREEADGEDARFAEADDEDAAPAPAKGSDNKESLALIARLLTKSDISKDMREELQGYKEDIADGEFEDMDRKYLRALYARLGKRR